MTWHSKIKTPPTVFGNWGIDHPTAIAAATNAGAKFAQAKT
jgi:hypothetical protein